MLGRSSSREWRRRDAWGHSSLADSSNSSSRSGEASVGDHGECDLSRRGRALNDSSSPWTACRNKLAWQKLNRLEARSSSSWKLTGN